MEETTPFAVKDCALISIATGVRVQTLRELKDKLSTVHPGSIYYHFWGRLLLPRFEETEYHNDFASWVYQELRDDVLAERLAAVDPLEFSDIDDLRNELIEIIEERLDELEYIPWAKSEFHFKRAQIVVFDTHHRIHDPKELAQIVPKMTLSSIFYHFIEARRRTPEHIDDFRSWLLGFDGKYKGLCQNLASIDPYFTPLSTLREKLIEVFSNYFEAEFEGEK